MATIDKLDISVYNLYAIRTKMLEQINQQIPFDKAGAIPPQTLIIGTYPKLTELDILLGVVPVQTPWAYFYPPKNFRYQRRSPFSAFRVVPSLGSLLDQEKDEEHLASIVCESAEEERERKVIATCLKQIDRINGWMGFIIGRVGQFLQG